MAAPEDTKQRGIPGQVGRRLMMMIVMMMVMMVIW